MSQHFDAKRLNVQALAESGQPLSGSTLLQNMKRLTPESNAEGADSTINWKLAAELRPGSGGQLDVWLQMKANASLALTCQRCMAPVQTPISVDQWYRFVATEEVAMAEDDASDEDLLVMSPQFDALEVLEDELLMALPLVPMHQVCPSTPAFSAGQAEMVELAPEKPNPFAALAQLKKTK
jgi:uncharacterized protein